VSDFVRSISLDAKPSYMPTRSIMQRLHIDLTLLSLVGLLTIAGLVVLYSASGGTFAGVKRQIAFLVLGYIAMFVVAWIPGHLWRQLAIPIYVLGIILLVMVMFVGVGAKGAVRWLDLGVIRFQPSEILKLALPLMLGTYFHKKRFPPTFVQIIVSCVIIFTPTLMIARQPDLGTSILIAASGLIVLLIAGLRWRYIITTVIGVASAAPLIWNYVLHDYQKTRVLTLLNPEADRWGAGWNIIQSKTAIGSGGFEGKGYMAGTQSHLDFLPESHTDFIIAVLAEEWGLIGVVALMALYLMIVAKGLWISLNAQDNFGRLVAGAITLTFFVYVFVNMGMVAGLLPVVGVPLPLVSQGGTSLVTIMTGFGILMGIATEQKRRNMF